MGENTAISWANGRQGRAGYTFNAWSGCWKISPGCKNCYAAARDDRYNGGKHWSRTGPREMRAEAYWRQPAKWNREAEAAGERRGVFCASLSDVGELRPDLVAPRDRLFQTIRDTPYLDWLLLTKRIEDLATVLPWAPQVTNPDSVAALGAEPRLSDWGKPWPNVWGGVTTEDQEHAAWRLAVLRRIPFAVRFASYEPALGPIDYTRLIDPVTGKPFNALRAEDGAAKLDRIIFGDESGPRRRDAEVQWARDARDQADAHGVAWHFKQWCGDDDPAIGGVRVRGKIHLPILDGEQRGGFPDVTP